MSITYDVVVRYHDDSNDTNYYFQKADDKETYAIADATISQTINKADTFTFTIYPDNPNYRLADGATGRLVYIYCYNSYRQNDTKLVWVGKMTSSTVDINLKKTVTCQGALSFLDDTIAPYKNYAVEKPSKLFNELIDNHNYQLALWGDEGKRTAYEKKITMNTIQTGDFIGTNTKYTTDFEQSSLDAIMDNIIDNYGGYLHISYKDEESSSSSSSSGDIEVGVSGDYVLLNYLQKSSTAINQKLEYGDNMIDFSYTENYVAYSHFLPLGATRTGYEQRVMLDGSIGGLYEFVRTPSTYGMRFGSYVFNEAEDKQTLSKLYASYKSQKLYPEEITATAKVYDKGMTSTSYPRFFVGNVVNIYSKPHNFSKNMQITGMKYSLDNPTVKELTFGTTEKTFMSNYLEDLYSKSKTKVNNSMAKSGLMQNVIKEIKKATSSS